MLSYANAWTVNTAGRAKAIQLSKAPWMLRLGPRMCTNKAKCCRVQSFTLPRGKCGRAEAGLHTICSSLWEGRGEQTGGIPTPQPCSTGTSPVLWPRMQHRAGHPGTARPHGHCPLCCPLGCSAHSTVGEEEQPPLFFLTASQLSLTRNEAEHTSAQSHRRHHEPDLSALEVPIWDRGALIALCNFQQRLGGPINYCLQNLLLFLDERFDEREQLLVFLVPSLPLPNTLPLIVHWCLPNLLSAHMVRPKSYYLMIQSDLRKSCNFLYKA